MKSSLCAVLIVALPFAPALAQPSPGAGGQAALATAPVAAVGGSGTTAYDGVVEALRQSALSAQVAGAVTQVAVRPGDAVRAGQVLVRLDARAAGDQAAAGDAQVAAAQAALDVANRDLERQRSLFEKHYVSQGSFDRVQAQQHAAQAQVDSLKAQAAAAHTQSGFYVVTAPYAGIVSEVSAVLGDMALPGRLLAVVYDPAQLRVTARLPQDSLGAVREARVEIPGAAGVPAIPARSFALPAVDPATHTVEVRAELARGQQGVVPGMFARIRLPEAPQDGGAAPQRLFVPKAAILRRGELTGVYVIDAQGRPQLRQVHLGESDGERIEVLAGVSAAERVALDPQAAARLP